MNRFPSSLLALIALCVGCDLKPGPMPPVETYFSPKGGCTEAVVAAINAAQKTVFVQAYSFTSAHIVQALKQAHERGVVVHIIIDKSNLTEKYSAADFIAHASIPLLIDARHSIAHNKIIIIDGETLITGSFNFTEQAEKSNAENLLVIHDRTLAQRYLDNWHDHEGHSEPYSPRGEVADESTSPPKSERNARRR